MILYETLYEKICRTLLCWYDNGKSLILGPKIIQQATDEIKMIMKKNENF